MRAHLKRFSTVVNVWLGFALRNARRFPMVKQLTRVVLLLMFFGITAIASRADSTNDFKVILNDPSCPTTAFCVDIGYTGTGTVTYTASDPLVFNAPAQAIPPDQTVACGSTIDPSIQCGVFTIPTGDPTTFLGVAFWGFTVSPDQGDLTVGLTGTDLLMLDLPSGYACDPPSACPNGIITLTPEPSTVLLLMSGLLGLAFLRKRFKPLLRAQAI
jgi:PEP-CTERM motif